MNRGTESFEGLKVLVVEDNEINQIVIKDTLEKIGCDVDAVLSGEEALRLIGENDYDAIMMDIRMPDMDGYETTRLIREKQDPDKPPLIIALTANALPEDREKCLDAGMDDYIAKPIQADSLKKVLVRHRKK